MSDKEGDSTFNQQQSMTKVGISILNLNITTVLKNNHLSNRGKPKVGAIRNYLKKKKQIFLPVLFIFPPLKCTLKLFHLSYIFAPQPLSSYISIFFFEFFTSTFNFLFSYRHPCLDSPFTQWIKSKPSHPIKKFQGWLGYHFIYLVFLLSSSIFRKGVY